MGIVEGVPGLVVAVEVGGQHLPEYSDTDEEEPKPKTCYAYVEAESGASFGISFRFQPDYPYKNEHFHTTLYLDGQFVAGWILTPTQIAAGRPYLLDRVQSDLGDRCIIEKFAFAELKINEGAANEKLWGKLGDLGTLHVKCERFRWEETSLPATPPPSNVRSKPTKKPSPEKQAKANPKPQQQSRKPVLDNDEVAEKNLKGRAISHQAKLTVVEERASTQSAPPRDNRRRVYIDDGPFATFVFKYRSHRALQGLCVIPRTPSPVPLEDRPIDDLAQDEMRELLKRQKEKREQNADLVKIKKEKRERSDDVDQDGEDDIEIDEEKSRKALKTTSDTTVAVIDLT